MSIAWAVERCKRMVAGAVRARGGTLPRTHQLPALFFREGYAALRRSNSKIG